MKQILSKTLMCAGLAGAILTGCTSEDLYNPEAVRQKAEKAFGMTIDPKQDWNMLAAIKANISIKEDALSNYTFKVYTSNPLAGNGATLLAEQTVSTDAQGTASANLNFDLPSYLEYVYVARVDDHGRRLVKSAKVSNGTLTMGFGTGVVTKGVVTESDLSSTKMECPYTEEEVQKLIDEAYDLKEGLSYLHPQYNYQATLNSIGEISYLTDNYAAKVTEEYACTLSLEAYSYRENNNDSWPWPETQLGTLKLIVDNGGILKLNSGEVKVTGLDIIVAAGGTLDLTNCQPLLLQDKTRIIVMPGGKVIDNRTSDTATINHQGELIYNAGTMDVKNINMTRYNGIALVYNADKGIIRSKDIRFSNVNSTLTNWGKIETQTITGNGGSDGNDWGQGTLNNGCLLRVTDKCLVVNLNQEANTAIECNLIRVNGNLTMRENSILRAKDLRMQKLDIQYCGSNDGHALISTETLGQFDEVTIGNHFYFEVGEFKVTQGGQTDDYLKNVFDDAIRKGGSEYTAIGEAPIFIEGSNTDDLAKADCIGKGNTPNNQGGDGDDTPNWFTYAFEDLNIDGGDYDMNDVVLYCSIVKDGKITVRLVAAGASKNLTIRFNDRKGNDIALFNGREVHDILGADVKTLVNTGAGVTANEQSTEIEVGSDFTYEKNGDFYIVDEWGRESHIPAFDADFKLGTNNVPYAICVPVEWKYPKETCKINSAYLSFEEWAANVDAEQDWYTKNLNEKNIY